ncbi:MAG: RNA polymerase sigma factor [Bacteroidales bacterium]|nr:RNA polymerase sigma factor [Bacteroidales bacterium]
MKKHKSDEELLEQIISNNSPHEAFKELIEKYQQPLYFHIRKILLDHDDTDDALQNTFIKAWQAIYDFKHQSKIYTWLYRIATNEALSILKKRNRFSFFSKDSQAEEWIARLESDPYFDGNEADLKLQKAILLLPEKQRIVFNMRYFDEMPYETISEILDTSVGALKASYHHAVKKIENFLQQPLNLDKIT